MKKVLLGISGSIAAYKTPELCRLLTKAHCEVKVVMTHSAQQFVSPLALKALTQDQVYTTDSLSDLNQVALEHINLARWADIILIAPASANIMAKLAHGITDDLLTSICLATQAPIVIAPSMNKHMWANVSTQANRDLLASRHFTFLGPDSGNQACGDFGEGRLSTLESIVDYIVGFSPVEDIFQGRHILITAGPTVEPIDPVRYMSNRSSGKMGYALASAAQKMGAKVILVSGPVSLCSPAGVELIQVTTAKQMLEAIQNKLSTVDIFIGTAAVADWYIKNPSEHKIKNKEENITLQFSPNVDIIATIAAQKNAPFMVGFAAETQNLREYAQSKLSKKKLDMVIANDVSREDIGFASDNNAVTMVTAHTQEQLPKSSKKQLAFTILEKIYQQFSAKAQGK